MCYLKCWYYQLLKLEVQAGGNSWYLGQSLTCNVQIPVKRMKTSYGPLLGPEWIFQRVANSLSVCPSVLYLKMLKLEMGCMQGYHLELLMHAWCTTVYQHSSHHANLILVLDMTNLRLSRE